MTMRHDPVTLIVRREVEPSHAVQYEAWLARLQATARHYPGYLGVHVQRPGPGQREYTSFYRFADGEALRAWEQSAERLACMAETPVEATVTAPRFDRVEGLEFWFTASGQSTHGAPVKWRMAVLIIVVVYGLIQILNPIVTLGLGEDTPLRLRMLVTVIVEVILMTWFVMPTLTRWLQRWLYPPSPR